ncbi:MAG: hypothetical protein JF626_08650, partial [Polaromonas sp.]|nr:hypothetical protein [Polaromonas sp.]
MPELRAPPDTAPAAMSELAQVREHYKAGKAALLASLGASGASSRGIHTLLQQLARHAD